MRRDIVAHRAHIDFRQLELAAARQQKIKQELRGVGMTRLIGDQHDPRHDQGIVLRDNDFDGGISRRRLESIRADSIITQRLPPCGHLGDDLATGIVQLDPVRTHRCNQFPNVAARLLILRKTQIADTRSHRIERCDPASIRGFPAQQSGEFGVSARRIRGGYQTAVIDKDKGLGGDAIGFVLPDRPRRQIGLFR